MSVGPLRVLVVDDEPMARARLRRMLGAEHGVQVLGDCSDGVAAAAALADLKPDVVFIDIAMPGLDGFAALDRAAPAWRPHVVLVTAYAQHAVNAFDRGAVDYLLKPYSRERLRIAVERARTERDRARSGQAGDADRYAERLPVPVGHRLRMLAVGGIDCIVAQANYVELHVASERLILRETMATMESRLDPKRFVRVHRSRIVRIDAVADIETLESGQYLLRLNTGVRISSGPAYRDRVRAVFGL